MKILVCISVTPETTAKISFTPDGHSLDETGVNFIINPYDEWYALTRAVELAESSGGDVVALNVGPEKNTQLIQKALAIGANSSVRIDAPANSAEQVAREIAQHASSGSYDIILTGKETIDHSSALVGSMVAELMDLPFVSFANSIEVDGEELVLSREIEGGIENIRSQMPVVISAAKGFGEQKIPNMRGIMMAKKKPQTTSEPTASDPNVAYVHSQAESKSGVTMIDQDNMAELIRLLKEEAKVI